MINQTNLNVAQLGTCQIPSSLKRKGKTRFVADSARVVYDTEVDLEKVSHPEVVFDAALS